MSYSLKHRFTNKSEAEKATSRFDEQDVNYSLGNPGVWLLPNFACAEVTFNFPTAADKNKAEGILDDF